MHLLDGTNFALYDTEAGGIGSAHQETLNKFLDYNDMAQLEYDFETYPMNERILR